jgi:hypothetical protein
VSIAAGILALITGLAYTLLGALTAYELGRHSTRRGFSHFGAAFMVMAFTCGPHHLVHAVHLLVEGERVTGQLVAALALGLTPGVVFVGLRMEAAFGGRGDRLVRGNPAWLVAAPWVITFLSGAVLAAALGRAIEHGASAWGVVPNVVLFFNYAVVGILVRRTQLARRPLLGGWSLSGTAMAGVFPTCGVSHLVAGLTIVPDAHMLLFDLPGVPSSIFFLWVVHRVHANSLPDWNRRPLVGRAAATSRPSPWAPVAADPH